MRIPAERYVLSHVLERRDQFLRGLESILHTLFEAALHQRPELARDRGIRRIQLGVDPACRVLICEGRSPPKRPPTIEHLVEHGADAEQVRAGVRGLAMSLLGRHVRQRTGYVFARVAFVRQTGPYPLRDAKVDDLDAAVGDHEDVRGLQIAVHDPAGVGCHQSARDCNRRLDGRTRGERTFAQPPGQRLSFEKLADEVRAPVVLSSVEDRHHVGMIEAADDYRLGLEALLRLRVRARAGPHDLHCDVPVETRVVGAIHLAHSSFAEKGDDPIAAQHRPGREGGGVRRPRKSFE